ncbi:hypothetical protein [Dyella sp. GSA-30]|uniref:hypothetical protein n=1 Tax=Dyella sp. GSA-30 TaxID=2994496 RepID=UPI00248FC7F3|nr:hypothetical protein [Dyella sp. GSA-30]BDU22151.1 hypothetical protein DYGSA30_36080 [Dyella sp. GSA-30]
MSSDVKIDAAHNSTLPNPTDTAVMHAELAAGGGAALVGFLQDAPGAVLRTAQDELRQKVRPEQFGAVADYDPATDTGTDNTPYFTAAISYLASLGGGVLALGSGKYLGQFEIDSPFIHIVGEGEWATSVYNVNNSPVVLITNTNNSITDITVEGMAILNRNPDTWNACDGIAIQSVQANQACSFLTFKDLYIFEMRYGIFISGGSIWNLYERVHVSTSLINGMNVDATDNVGAQTFNMCRFAACGQHGIFVNSSFSTFPVVNWTFYNTTIEHNLANGVRVTGTGGGIQAWIFSGCYMEENTYGISPGGTNGLVKAHVFIDCPNVFGLTFDTCTFFGASPSHANLDYSIYVNSTLMTTVIGEVKGCRFGTSTTNDIFWPAGVTLGKNVYTSTNNVDRLQGSFDIRDMTQAPLPFTPSVSFNGSSAGIAYSNRIGRYALHGNVVYFEIYVSLTSKGTATGVATIDGLPVATSSTTNLIPAFSVHADQLASGVNQVVARALAGSTSIQLNKFSSGTIAQLSNADFGNFTAISVSGHYFLQ